jgi:hypothetical protein
MSWLEGRLPKWGPFGGGSTAVLDREEAPEPALPDNSSPQLMILVNDASGMACFKTHTFPDAQSATEFILYWFRHDTDGFSAFWAMTEEPRSGVDTVSGAIAEPLVMIKDAHRVDVVYSFSFVDIESAQAFARDEVGNGTDLGQITLYWAVPVRLATDARGETMLTPSVPPGAVSEEGIETETIDMWAAQKEPAVENVAEPTPTTEARMVFQEAPNARTGVTNGTDVGQETFELTSWIERARKKPFRNEADDTPSGSSSSESAFETRELAADTPFEPHAVAHETPLDDYSESIESAVSLSEAITEASAIAWEPPAAVEAFESVAAGPTAELGEEEVAEDTLIRDALLEDAVVEAILEEAVMDAAAIESVDAPPRPEVEERVQLDEQREEHLEVSVDDSAADVQTEADSRAEEPREESDRSENGFIMLEPFDIVVHTNGHAKVEPAEPPSEVTESPEATIRTKPEQTEDGEVDQRFDIRIDIYFGSARAMKVQRWGAQENPFKGFKSPPGRF